jgi:hypothetical protein
MEEQFNLINKRVNRGHWESKENHKLFAIQLGKILEFETKDDWYKITCKSITKNKGGGLLKKYYNNSPILFVRSIFIHDEWLEWKFAYISRGYWDKFENRKNYAVWLGEKLTYKTMEDWYNITIQQINNNYGGSLMVLKYNSSPIQFLRDVFPDYEWLEWKLNNTTSGYWEIIENHTKFANWLGKELEFNNMEDWYNITYDIIYKNGGSVLLTSFYNHSPLEFLQKIYKNYDWLGWKFTSSPNNFWDDEENIKNYAVWLGKILGYSKMEDWYKINTNIISDNYGGGIITYYKLIDFIKKSAKIENPYNREKLKKNVTDDIKKLCNEVIKSLQSGDSDRVTDSKRLRDLYLDIATLVEIDGENEVIKNTEEIRQANSLAGVMLKMNIKGKYEDLAKSTNAVVVAGIGDDNIVLSPDLRNKAVETFKALAWACNEGSK